MSKQHNYSIFQKFVEDMVRTKTLVTNSGVFEVNGKHYMLVAEVKELKREQS